MPTICSNLVSICSFRKINIHDYIENPPSTHGTKFTPLKAYVVGNKTLQRNYSSRANIYNTLFVTDTWQ